MLRKTCALLLFLLLPLIIVRAQFDLIIKNGRIIDGGGNPWYAADVGVRDGRIAALGRLDTTQSRPAFLMRGE